jgi:phosphate transport system substrate-binding protein
VATTVKTLTRALTAGVVLAGLWSAAQAGDISGAGATFPYPIYAKWAEAYKAKSGIGLNYQSIGSGGGIKQIKSKTVDFGASDMPLEPKDLEEAGLMQFPMVMGGVVPVVNVKGLEPGQLKLDGPTLADIYLGKITKWNDAAITALNAGVSLPDQAIAVVHRSDGSGTTFIFADYLSKVSPEWKDKVGENTSVEWPVGLGGKGNEGVAALTSRTDGAIGYVEYAYAKQNKMIHTLMKNKDGQFAKPEAAAFQASAANADWAAAPGFHLLLTDQPGATSWPISGATFILMYKKQDKPETAKQVLDFFDWAYKNGGQLAEGLDYVPMPGKVVGLVEGTWKQDIKGGNGQPVWDGSGS